MATLNDLPPPVSSPDPSWGGNDTGFDDESVITRIPLALPSRAPWRWLIEPSPRVAPAEARLRARLLAGIMLFLTLAALIGTVAVRLNRHEWNTPLLICTLLGAASYVLSRTPYQRLAAGLSIVALCVPAMGHTFVATRRELLELVMTLSWLALPMMLSTYTVSMRGGLLTNLACILFVLLLPVLQHDITYTLVLMPLGLLVCIAGLGLVGSLLRYQNERALEKRMRDLQGAEFELLATKRGLQRRVIERTTELRRRSDTLHAFVQSSPAAAFMQDGEGRITMWNPAAERIFGWEEHELLGGFNPLIDAMQRGHPESIDEILIDYEMELPHRTGRTVTASVSTAPLHDEHGSTTGLIGLVVDTGDRHRLQDQLRQAQKMEAVGQLAGGVAHDFNNLLAVIIGNCEVALMGLDPGSDAAGDVRQIRAAGERASALTRQLLAFGRRQTLFPQPLQLNQVLEGMSSMLGRLIREDIRLELALDARLGHIEADLSQIEQVILNLAINGSDAMPEGGVLTIATRSEPCTAEHFPERVGSLPGHCVVLEVSDTGEGMSPEVMARVFEPFFTTKQLGQGTGLGLATVYGIVSQSGGAIHVHSTPGQGSRFLVTLPQLEESGMPAGRDGSPPRQTDLAQGNETVLLVEDEEQLRSLLARQLGKLGYQVVEADNGVRALERFREHADRIGLVLTDVVMPEMGGVEAVRQLRELAPGLKVLFMSGHTDWTLEGRGLPAQDAPLLQKPFDLQTLARHLRQLLDGG
ncbi:MAG: response regulator [Pseudomonadota bacterium]